MDDKGMRIQTTEALEKSTPPKAVAMPYDPALDRDALAAIEVEKSRAVQQVQAQFLMARRFPRDIIAAETKIYKYCERYSFATEAIFSYKRGGQIISDGSIRLAELMANAWGNLDYGWRELARRKGQSDVEAVCLDLETNTRVFRQFVVEHAMKANDKIKFLTDPRDIYERMANEAQRRLRACIFQSIPIDIRHRALAIVDKALTAGEGQETLPERVRKAVMAFESQGVKQSHLEEYLGHPIDVTTQPELAKLLKVFNAISREGVAREEFFKLAKAESAGGPAGDLKDRIRSADTTTSSILTADELLPWEKETR